MKNFTVVQEHFRKLRCAHCEAPFTPEGVRLLREEKDYWVVRVHCTSCQQPSGVAVVGVDFDGAQPGAAQAPSERRTQPVRGIYNSRQEEEKFAQLAPITSDDVLDASRFFRALEGDWMRHLPKR